MEARKETRQCALMEKRLFYNWVLRQNGYLKFAEFTLKRAVHKMKRDLLRETCVFYPPEIRAAAPFSFKPERLRWAFGSASKQENSASARKLDGFHIDWQREHDDPEETEALHRWNWLLALLPDRTSNEGAITRWVDLQLIEWVRLFSHEIEREARRASLIWESYTVGERISNSVLFYYFMKKEPPKAVMESLTEQARFLVQRLEYNGMRTGNHILNNARAVYLAGVAFDAPAWRQFASLIMRRELPVLVTADGFLREGSSHYQFLFTRWVLEVAWFAELAGDGELIEMIRPAAGLLIKRCSFFLVKGADGSWDFPRFGDISPDFRPGWLVDLVWSKPAARFLEPQREAPTSGSDTWAGLFGFAEGNGTENGRKEDAIQAFPGSGWYRLDAAGHTLFFRLDESGPPMHAGHHHNDLFHFCLFYNGEPVLIDAGRLNYMLSDARGSYGLRPEAHNAFTIDGLGAAPSGWHLYPQAYSRFKNRVEIETDRDGIWILLTSNAFSRMERPVEARRTFFISRPLFRITDSFSGTGEHEIKTFFHWDKALALSQIKKGEWDISSGAVRGRFRVIDPQSSSIRHERGGEGFFGWMVEGYGSAVKAGSLEISARAAMPFEAVYEISWEERAGHVRY